MAGMGFQTEENKQLAPIEPSPVKPGLKTSELYMTLIIVLPLMAKVFSLDIEQDKIESIAYLLALAAPAAFAVWAYIKGRTNVKQTAIEATAYANNDK